MDHLGLITRLQVPKHRGVIEEGEVDHVLAFLELGRVDFSNKGALEGELLMAHSNHTLAGGVLQVTRLEQTLLVPSSLVTRDPDGLLGVVDLGLVSPLHIHGGQEELGGVRVGLTRLREFDMSGHLGRCSENKVTGA